MEQASKITNVDFAAYCKAFEIFSQIDGSSKYKSWICDSLDKDPDFYSVSTLYRDEEGDGIVRVPDFGIDKGKAVVRGSRLLLEDGRVLLKDSKGERAVENVDGEFARIFIAGAFGKGELKDSSGIDDTIAEGVHELYETCLADWDSCLNSTPAEKVALAWRRILGERKEEREASERLKESKAAVAKMQKEFEELSAKAENRESLLIGVAPYKSRMPASVSTVEECEESGRLLKEMIAVAQAVIANDKKRTEERDRQSRLATYRAENPKMRKRISEAENEHGLHWRFTNAFDAAMKCMPTPRTAEEEYCVEKNKNDMASGLEWKARDFPKREVCDGKWIPSRRSCVGRAGDRDCTDIPGYCEGKTRSVGSDYTEEELISFAKQYCSTTCRSSEDFWEVSNPFK